LTLPVTFTGKSYFADRLMLPPRTPLNRILMVQNHDFDTIRNRHLVD